jgi:hypothetical protein
MRRRDLCSLFSSAHGCLNSEKSNADAVGQRVAIATILEAGLHDNSAVLGARITGRSVRVNRPSVTGNRIHDDP